MRSPSRLPDGQPVGIPKDRLGMENTGSSGTACPVLTWNLGSGPARVVCEKLKEKNARKGNLSPSAFCCSLCSVAPCSMPMCFSVSDSSGPDGPHAEGCWELGTAEQLHPVQLAPLLPALVSPAVAQVGSPLQRQRNL